ncbi:MAG: hypothetical protein ABID04_04085, partial [Patescibacteria group bacterium]
MSLTYSGTPSSVEEDTPFSVDVFLNGAPSERIYYLRAAFQKETGSKYFGYTKNNGGVWVDENGPTEEFYKITTNSEGNWSGKLEAKTDLANSGFVGEGDYF